MSSIPPTPPPSNATPLRRSNSTPNLTATTAADSLEQAAKPDSVSITGKTQQATNTAENTAKAPKPFYQPVIDFIQNVGRKIMDIFTPTSQEAIEKALTKAQFKSEIYSVRLERNKEYLNTKGLLSDLQKEVLIKDSQKTDQKLKKLSAQADKLSAKLDKLTGVSAKPPEAKAESKATKAATSEAAATVDEATELAAKASAKGAQQNATEGAEKVVKEAAEAVEGADTDKALQELIETVAKQFEEITGKAKESFPELIDNLASMLKKAV